MPFNPQTGITGSVVIGGVTYAFGKWTLNMKTNMIPVNNFTGGGFQQLVPGVTSAELTLEALTYDQGNMPLATGTLYVFNLNYNALSGVTVSIYVESIEPTVDYDGAQPIKVTGKSHGSFNALIA